MLKVEVGEEGERGGGGYKYYHNYRMEKFNSSNREGEGGFWDVMINTWVRQGSRLYMLKDESLW